MKKVYQSIVDNLPTQNEEFPDRPGPGPDNITPEPTASIVIPPTIVPTPVPTLVPTPSPSNVLETSKQNLRAEMDKRNSCYKPSAASGFKCGPSETRGHSIFCVMPYWYTVKPRYTKVDHNNNRVMCNQAFLRFDKAEVEIDGRKIPLSYEDVNPWNRNEKDYGCMNYVGTAEGPIGRQHWRSTSKYSEIEAGSSVRINVYFENKSNCLIIK